MKLTLRRKMQAIIFGVPLAVFIMAWAAAAFISQVPNVAEWSGEGRTFYLLACVLLSGVMMPAALKVATGDW